MRARKQERQNKKCKVKMVTADRITGRNYSRANETGRPCMCEEGTTDEGNKRHGLTVLGYKQSK